MTPPLWLDAAGRRSPTRACWTCGREVPITRLRAEHLRPQGWEPAARFSSPGGAAARSNISRYRGRGRVAPGADLGARSGGNPPAPVLAARAALSGNRRCPPLPPRSDAGSPCSANASGFLRSRLPVRPASHGTRWSPTNAAAGSRRASTWGGLPKRAELCGLAPQRASRRQRLGMIPSGRRPCEPYVPPGAIQPDGGSPSWSSPLWLRDRAAESSASPRLSTCQ